VGRAWREWLERRNEEVTAAAAAAHARPEFSMLRLLVQLTPPSTVAGTGPALPGQADVWRRVLVPAALSLTNLHHVLQTVRHHTPEYTPTPSAITKAAAVAVRMPLTMQVFDWDDAQPHRFRTADGSVPAENEDAVLLLDVARQGRETLWYDYGSGDPPWQHRLDVVSAMATTQPVPRCEAGAGTRPREVGLPLVKRVRAASPHLVVSVVQRTRDVHRNAAPGERTRRAS